MKTDHKPLIGLQKKFDSIENQRLLAMVLATSEFSFNLAYLAGKKNIIADCGTYETNPRHKLASTSRRSFRTQQSSAFQRIQNYTISHH